MWVFQWWWKLVTSATSAHPLARTGIGLLLCLQIPSVDRLLLRRQSSSGAKAQHCRRNRHTGRSPAGGGCPWPAYCRGRLLSTILGVISARLLFGTAAPGRGNGRVAYQAVIELSNLVDPFS